MIKPIRFSLTKNQHNKLTFQSGEERIDIYVLEEEIFRVYQPFDKEVTLDRTWIVAPGQEDIPYEGRDRFDKSMFTLPPYEVEEQEDEISISTSKLKAVITLTGFTIQWYSKNKDNWVRIAGDRKTQSYNFNNNLGSEVVHYMERSTNDLYFGLGEKGGLMNRSKKRYQMRTIDAMGYDAESTDPLYKNIPFYLVHNLSHSNSYAILYDNYSDSVFDMGAELDNYHGLYRYYQAKKGDLDYYFILGPTIKNAVERYTWLTGRMIMPPKWSLGYSGSTMTYTDAPDAQEQLKRFVDDCKHHDIPCDSFQLSSGYTSIGDKRYVFNWNKSKIPDPNQMNDYFHEHSIQVCANIKPCLLEDHPQYEELKRKGYFVKRNKGNDPEISQFWDALGSYLDFTQEGTIRWWKDNIKEMLLSYGIDSTWNDNNEYEIWDEGAWVYGFGKKIPVSYVKPILTLLMVKASFEAQKEFNPSIRPYLISRSGVPGMHRYVQTWSGDNFTEWKTIRYNLKMGLSLSLSGIYNFGHDVGGFAGNAPEPELFIRWLQNGIFHPRFTIHSWNDDQTVNVPWMYPEYMDIIRGLMKERVKWIPYLYHLTYLAHQNYQPILVPTFYHFEDDSKTFGENDEFMVGEDLLIANVMDKGITNRKVYLPLNEDGWYDINSGDWYEGGQEIIVDASLETIPMFAQSGAVLPIRDGEITVENKQDTERGLLVFPQMKSVSVKKKLYEDDGYSMDYRDGVSSWLIVKMKTTEKVIDIEVHIEGEYKPPYSSITLYFPKTEQRKILINKSEVPQPNEYRVHL
ncbi:TIM-barrel domain-containing protein [Alkalihalobacillus sp. TS-13]|uniref:glycoside hydrolase family 31 protein n=1 Tax=Alkalihalobacillus sp. TS-13 TaxID=2842455 RepID=UPI001C86EA2C|nr:glycoside hydrolase family 31 protein [Alkalihalobacillus sp. TS-13]